MTGFRGWFLTCVVAACLACAVCPRSWAGDPTKNEQFQPGAEGAKLIDAAGFDSLQAAFQALPASGGVVTIPPGRYEITEPLRIRAGDVMVRGSGTSTHIVNKNEGGLAGIDVRAPEGVKSIWRVQLCDLRVTGNPKSGPGIYAKSVDELLISRVAAEHNGTYGIFLDNCYEDPRISDCLINYNKHTGLNLAACHDIVVSANQFEENKDAVRCIDGFNLTLTGNNLDDHLGNGVVIENTYGSLVSANMIEECAGHAVVLARECYGDTVSANTLAHCQGEGVRLDNVRDITVSANNIVLMAQPGVHALNGAGELTITGNTFCRYPYDPSKRHKLDPACGIVLESAPDVTITGNTFTRLHQTAVTIKGKDNKRIILVGNSILNPSQEKAGAYSALYFENLSDSVITGNIISDTQSPNTMKQVVEFTGDAGTLVVGDNLVTGVQRLIIPTGIPIQSGVPFITPP
ncbi:MAG TPA: right-handed parallel beta-helix repeat-containing protein [Candidatus Hydrogenedentes bacterium]|nr:right-handed parallel beta-helix repeat-containing protein [Candidatus Hydrogenedentota bacterium]